jgi:hypothetical protein
LHGGELAVDDGAGDLRAAVFSDPDPLLSDPAAAARLREVPVRQRW